MWIYINHILKKKSGNVLKLSRLDGQAFNGTPANYFDGGTIPLAGTASYDPSITYGPDSPLIED